MMGPAVGTQVMCRALRDAGVDVIHVNTFDHRHISNVGVLDIRNVTLALRHAFQLAWKAFREPVCFVYIPISQNRWGYARDALFISISRALRRRVVIHFHGARLQEFFTASTPLEQWVIRKTLQSATLAIALTPRLVAAFDGLVSTDKVRVLENAIPDPWPNGITNLLETRRGRREKLRLLYVANDFATKGAHVAAAALATPALRDAVLHIVGAPALDVVRRLEQQANDRGVRERVHLLGELLEDDKVRQYEWADIFVYPTENDAQPLVVLEAMAAGLPIVTTAEGGIPETVGNAAIVVDVGDHPGFMTALTKLAASRADRLALGAAARARFVERYTAPQFQGRLEATISDLLRSDAAQGD
jgi:glycosyltransferase involved in cell wall biosynthesis